MATTRRTFLTASGAGASGLLVGTTLAAAPADALPQAAEGNPVPQPRARSSVRMRTGRPGLQWVTSTPVSLRFDLPRGGTADLTLTVLSGSKVDAGRSSKVTVSSPAGGSWSTQQATVTLAKGRNLVLVTGTGTSTRGPVHLDSISVG